MFSQKTRLEIPSKTVCTGRVRTFIEQPEKQTMAGSCTLYLYKNDLEDALLFIDPALRGGAGVKIQLEKFVPRQPVEFKWGFFLREDHPDLHLVGKDEQVYSRLTALLDLDNPALIKVADSMEENDGNLFSIQNSWLKFIELARLGRNVVVDLSALRPAGTKNKVGLIASGPLGYGDGDGSFLSIYEQIANHLKKGDMISLLQLFGQLNRVLRRGGTYKNGICCSGLNYRHPDIKTYLTCDLSSLPGGQKKSVRYDKAILQDTNLCALVLQELNRGGLFLEQIIDPELFANVCVEVQQLPESVCLLVHGNGATCNSPEDLIDTLVATAEFGTDLHLKWRQQAGKKADIYLPIEQDRQIGVGWCGWANFLRRMGVTYEQHVEALEAYLEGRPYHENAVACEIAECLVRAYFTATMKSDAKMIAAGYAPLERIFTMAPCQRNWVDYQDPDGYALCRSIDPPFDRFEYRDSHTDTASTGRYDHGPVETMSDVGHDLHQRHWEAWQRVMNLTGRAHTMSFDLWKKVDMEWFRDFVLRSPLQTTYYQFADKLDQQYLNKGQVWEAFEACDLEEGCVSCAE